MSLDPPAFRIFSDLSELPGDFGPCALTIGNFDGVHAGHRQIIQRLVQISRAHGWKAAVLTFNPHPVSVIAPERSPRLMTTPLDRCEYLRETGVDQVLILPFDSTVAAWTPDFFVRDVLAKRLGARAVLVGRDFRFGYKQEGDTALLAHLGAELDILTELVPPITIRGARVSSSLIRSLVEEGRVALACRHLARPFTLQGSVVKGQGIGTKQTVPTLNLAPTSDVIPKTGVYVTRTHDLDSECRWKSITNVGYRPTFNGDGLTIETFLLEPLDQTPSRIRIDFHFRLRDERKFDSPEALKSQILKDVARVQKWFRRGS